MFTGKLDRQLRLQTNTPVQDTYGEPVASWTTTATIWGEQMSQRVAERFTGDQDAGFKFTNWRIRYRPGVNNLQRVLDSDGNVYNIHGVTEVARKHYLILTTELVL